MIISMQGDWSVTVKLKAASFPQRFIVQGATTGNGIYSGAVGTSANVTGDQWSIAIQNDPGTGWQTSETSLKFPHKIGGSYEFDIHSNDAGGDEDFNDLVLTCDTIARINDFIIYGNVSLYSGNCIFNPCRKFPFVIDNYSGLMDALKNPKIYDYIERYYPERIPEIDPIDPIDPAPYFKPIVFDLDGTMTKPNTAVNYRRLEAKTSKKAKEGNMDFAMSNFEKKYSSLPSGKAYSMAFSSNVELATNIGGLFWNCQTNVGSNLTLTFEEYDRTVGELAGGSYTGTGNRRLLGDTITDMNGNYIFRFNFDMSPPGLEDAADFIPGENIDSIIYPDIIVKIVDYEPFEVKYESAPFNNVSNLKRINLCLPESQIKPTSACFNGNMIGSLGNVFIGGNQNTSGSTLAPILRRDGYSNYLESNGVISVNNPLAGFNIECAAWRGTIDMKGCMYDATKSATENKIKWYTIRVRRAGTAGWDYVSQNYKHPKFSKRNLPNYIGDDVGPFYPNAGASLDGNVPAYVNIQREIFIDGIDWEFSNLDRYMRLNTALYDVIEGVRTPGTIYVRVDGYDKNGQHVPSATDMVALFVHNNGLNFKMTTPVINDPSVLNAGCGLHRLTDAQMKTPIVFLFKVNDPYGFVNSYALTMGRCPGTSLDLTSDIEANFILTGAHTFPGGSNPANVQPNCPGYTGTLADYSNAGMVNVEILPPATATAEGWIKTGEYFTIYSFGLKARQRVTNGYNTGLSSQYRAWSQIMMERLNP